MYYRVLFIRSDDIDGVLRVLAECGCTGFMAQPHNGWINVLLPVTFDFGPKRLAGLPYWALHLFCTEDEYGFDIYFDGVLKCSYLAGPSEKEPVSPDSLVDFSVIQDLVVTPKGEQINKLTRLYLDKLESFLVTKHAPADDYLDGGPNEVLIKLLGLRKLDEGFEDYFETMEEDPEGFKIAFSDLIFIGSNRQSATP